jgi:zinc transport system substrate-binding protein
MADLAGAFGEQLAELDPDNADAYRANAADLAERLGELDTELQDGLAECQGRMLVTNHTAFGYFAERYDFEEIGIAGLSPSEEPSAGTQAEIADVVADEGVRTIYYETTVSPAIAETIADESGAETAVLDPLEGLLDESEGSDYIEVMRSNLENLQNGQPCP